MSPGFERCPCGLQASRKAGGHGRPVGLCRRAGCAVARLLLRGGLRIASGKSRDETGRGSTLQFEQLERGSRQVTGRSVHDVVRVHEPFVSLLIPDPERHPRFSPELTNGPLTIVPLGAPGLRDANEHFREQDPFLARGLFAQRVRVDVRILVQRLAHAGLVISLFISDRDAMGFMNYGEMTLIIPMRMVGWPTMTGNC